MPVQRIPLLCTLNRLVRLVRVARVTMLVFCDTIKFLPRLDRHSWTGHTLIHLRLVTQTQPHDTVALISSEARRPNSNAVTALCVQSQLLMNHEQGGLHTQRIARAQTRRMRMNCCCIVLYCNCIHSDGFGFAPVPWKQHGAR